MKKAGQSSIKYTQKKNTMKFINQITLLLALATFVYSGNIWAYYHMGW